ncbi:MAG: MFS transporter, partial [Pseudomonadota bacterium]|nr:MFS transporter [Pseudomonadota bacterium]
LSAHVQENMGWPRQWLGLLYFCGGAAAFFSMRFTGRLSDRIGYTKTAFYATIGLWLTLYAGFYAQWHAVPVLLVFVLFMVTMSTRNVTTNALISKIPKPQERAGFMSLVSAAQHLMSGAGAMVSTLMLTETPDHRLAGMENIALLSMLGFGASIWLMYRIEKIVSAQACDAVIQAELTQL